MHIKLDLFLRACSGIANPCIELTNLEGKNILEISTFPITESPLFSHCLILFIIAFIFGSQFSFIVPAGLLQLKKNSNKF